MLPKSNWSGLVKVLFRDNAVKRGPNRGQFRGRKDWKRAEKIEKEQKKLLCFVCHLAQVANIIDIICVKVNLFQRTQKSAFRTKKCIWVKLNLVLRTASIGDSSKLTISLRLAGSHLIDWTTPPALKRNVNMSFSAMNDLHEWSDLDFFDE